MQPSVMSFIRENLYADEVYGKRVLEVGSRDVNGSPRSYVLSREPKEYIGIDLQNGPGVDLVLDGAKVAEHFGPESVDVVICAETLEHTKDWRAVVSSMKRVLKTGGVLIVTVPAPGFPYHPYPVDYWRWTDDHMRATLADMRIENLREDPAPGVFVRARKPDKFQEVNLSYLRITALDPKMNEEPPPPPPEKLPEKLPEMPPEGRFINVGCGTFPIEGAENLNLTEVKPIAGREKIQITVADARTYDYRNAARIYAGHFLEHLSVEDARKFMSRVLEHALPGAILAVTIPAWDRCQHASFDVLQDMHGYNGSPRPGEDHLSAWRTEDLVREMKAAGWEEVVEWPDCPWVTAPVAWQACVRGKKAK